MDQWNNQGGGYFNENGPGTPGTDTKSKPAARQQFLCPVVIRQILEAPEDGLKVGNYTATTITVVGIVTNVDVSSTNIKFTICDDTGHIDCLDWIESEDSGEQKKVLNISDNGYYQVFGCIKSPQGKRRVMVFKVVPIEDFCEYTSFLADVLAVNRYAEKVNNAAGAMEVTTSMSSNRTGGGYEDQRSAFTPVQRAVLDAIKAVDSQYGWSKHDPILKSKFSPKLIEDALEFLIGEGHIYSTIDEDHFNSVLS